MKLYTDLPLRVHSSTHTSLHFLDHKFDLHLIGHQNDPASSGIVNMVGG